MGRERLEAGEKACGDGAPAKRRQTEAVVEEQPAQGEGLRHVEARTSEGQRGEERSQVVGRKAPAATFGGDEHGLQPNQGIAAVRLEQHEGAARSQDAARLGEGQGGVLQVVQQVADEYASEGPGREGQGGRVRCEEAGARDSARREASLRQGPVDADGRPRVDEARQVGPLAATHLQARRVEQREVGSEQGVLDGRKAGIGGGPVVVRGIRAREVRVLPCTEVGLAGASVLAAGWCGSRHRRGGSTGPRSAATPPRKARAGFALAPSSRAELAEPPLQGADTPPRGGRLEAAGGWLVGAAVAAAIFLVTGEVLARALGIVDRLNGYTRVLFARGPAPELPYVMRPRIRTQLGGIEIRTNALGLRGPDVPRRDPQAMRVLVLGDSVVFGQGVPEHETFPARLAVELAARGIRAEAINAGVQGYDTAAEAALLAYIGPEIAPDIVLTGMSLNDYERPPRYHPIGVLARQEGGADEESWLARSELVLLLRWVWDGLRGKLWHQRLQRLAEVRSRSGAAMDAAVAAAHARFYARPDSRALERVREGVGRLREESRRLGARLLIAVFPEAWQLAEPAGSRQPQDRLLEICRAVEVHCIDLLPAFREAGGMPFLDTQHPNAAGHSLAAAVVAPVVAERF